MGIGRGFEIVRDHQDGLTQAVVQVAQDRQNGARIFAVEISGRLVGQKNRGMIHDGAGDGDALLLAAGKARGL